ncbi:MAG: hypothetical protein WD227_13610 [Vicinamibacterales bacterium]
MLKPDVPSSAAAYELYLRANELSRDSTHWSEALALYDRCVTEDPHYATGWAGVGRMPRMIGKVPGHRDGGAPGARRARSESRAGDRVLGVAHPV